MRVEIWSDIACPFCYIGKRRYEEALSRLDFGGEVETVYRSFELDPYAERDVGYDVYDMLAAKYGMTRERAVAMNENVAKLGESAGIDFAFDKVILTNTFDAHRLTQLANKHGKMRQMIERLFRAYFTEGRHVGDHETLIELAAEAGLDRGEAEEALKSGAHADAVRSDEAEAARLGIRGVPFFVINRKYGISGAQSVELFVETLRNAKAEEEAKLVIAQGGDAPACGPGGCAPEASGGDRAD